MAFFLVEDTHAVNSQLPIIYFSKYKHSSIKLSLLLSLDAQYFLVLSNQLMCNYLNSRRLRKFQPFTINNEII